MTPRPRAADLLAAVAGVLLFFNVAVWLAGESPAGILRLLASGILGSSYGLGQCLAKATPLVWTGAAVGFALHARLFNIGVEGQCAAGILLAAVVGAIALVLSVFAYVPSAFLAWGLYGLAAEASKLPLRMNLPDMAGIFVLTLIMAVAATLLAIGKIRKADPVDLFS